LPGWRKTAREETFYIRGPMQKSGIMPWLRMQFVFSGVRTKVSTNSPMRHHYRANNSKYHGFATFFFNCIILNSVEDGRLLAARKRIYIATLAVQTAA
jgi:hypothetical protein